MTPHHVTVLSVQMECLFSKMSNNDQKNLLHAAKPTSSSKGTSIKTISTKAREMMNRFCQIHQFFEDNENVLSCDYCSIEELNKLNIQASITFTYYISIYIFTFLTYWRSKNSS